MYSSDADAPARASSSYATESAAGDGLCLRCLCGQESHQNVERGGRLYPSRSGNWGGLQPPGPLTIGVTGEGISGVPIHPPAQGFCHV